MDAAPSAPPSTVVFELKPWGESVQLTVIHSPLPGVSQVELRQIYPAPGEVEHDAEEIWGPAVSTVRECLAKAKLGWEPTTQLEAGLRKTIDYFASR